MNLKVESLLQTDSWSGGTCSHSAGIFCSEHAGCGFTPCPENILFGCMFAVLFMFLMLCMKYMNASPFFVIDMLLPPERDRHVFASCKLAVVGVNEKPEFIALLATSLIYICKLGWSPKHQFISISYFLVCWNSWLMKFISPSYVIICKCIELSKH